MNKLNLKQTQETFWQLTQEPEGIKKAVQIISQTANAPFRQLKEFILAKTGEESIERMEIYSNMYFIRLHDILKENFPATVVIIGEENFYRLCVDYLQKHPSKYYDISLIGMNLVPFIQEHSISNNYPYLADLAEIESQRVEIFVESDANVCELDDLKSIPPENWGDLQFQLIPASRIVSSKWNLINFWKSFLDYEVQSKVNENLEPPSKDLIEIEPTNEQSILIWRKGFTVYFQTISNKEKNLLNTLKNPTRFAWSMWLRYK